MSIDEPWENDIHTRLGGGGYMATTQAITCGHEQLAPATTPIADSREHPTATSKKWAPTS